MTYIEKYNLQNWDYSSLEISQLKQLNEWVRNKPLHEYRVPVQYLPKNVVYNDIDTSNLSKSIDAFFKVIGGYANQINTTGRMIKNKSGVWVNVPGTTIKGTSDLFAAIPGVSYHIELKQHPKDVQSPEQKEYQKMVEAMGHCYIIARNFDGFIFLFKRSLVKRHIWK
jgi:hypothetical protein